MTALAYTPLDEIEKIHARLREGFKSGKMQSIEYRKYQLSQLIYLIKDNAEAIENAVMSDLGRPILETRLLEIDPTIGEIAVAYENVEKWAKPEQSPFDMNWFAMKPTTYKEPKGTVLIISPFNYPIWLLITPLAGAMAAGNTVLLKPSESTPAWSSLLAELVPKYLDHDIISVVNGAVPETTKVLELHWDHILYTGSGRVGRIVATAAAKHLTPVSLELGGKSPVIVDPATIDLRTAARRILWGKCANAGQTCVAPDYVLVPRSYQETLIEALKKTYKEFYGQVGPKDPGAFARIATPQAFRRIKGLLDATNGKIVIGGETDESQKFIAPTIVADVSLDDSLMSEEIFGPVLPIVPVDDVDEAIRYVNAHDHPLAIYLFSHDASLKEKVRRNTQSGGLSINEVLIHLGAPGTPFGGIGPSGSGYYTGKFSFDMFTHLRASIDSPSWLDKILGFRYPPYTPAKIKRTASLAKSVPARYKAPPAVVATSRNGRRSFILLALAIALAGLVARRSKAAARWIGVGSA